jgi:sugar phosphate isomerase/epimerase
LSRTLRLSLDHLTVVDANPAQLTEIAAETGFQGVCLFLQSMDVLPLMPSFDLVADRAERRRTRDICRDLGIAVDLAYPFTLTSRSTVEDFSDALEAAAELGAECVNVLLYDREAQRRLDQFAAFGAHAASLGLKTAVEFFPPSQIPTLTAAIALVEAAGPAERIGVTLDLLHLMRSGEGLDAIARVPSQRIVVAQLCDGPATVAPDRIFTEAANQRALPGEGAFDLPGFVAALPSDTRLSVEIPRDNDARDGVSRRDRARNAQTAVRAALAAIGRS